MPEQVPVHMKLTRDTAVSAIESLQKRGEDVNPYSLADELRVPHSVIVVNADIMELLSLARGEVNGVVAAEYERLLRRVEELEESNASLLSNVGSTASASQGGDEAPIDTDEQVERLSTENHLLIDGRASLTQQMQDVSESNRQLRIEMERLQAELEQAKQLDSSEPESDDETQNYGDSRRNKKKKNRRTKDMAAPRPVQEPVSGTDGPGGDSAKKNEEFLATIQRLEEQNREFSETILRLDNELAETIRRFENELANTVDRYENDLASQVELTRVANVELETARDLKFDPSEPVDSSADEHDQKAEELKLREEKHAQDVKNFGESFELKQQKLAVAFEELEAKQHDFALEMQELESRELAYVRSAEELDTRQQEFIQAVQALEARKQEYLQAEQLLESKALEHAEHAKIVLDLQKINAKLQEQVKDLESAQQVLALSVQDSYQQGFEAARREFEMRVLQLEADTADGVNVDFDSQVNTPNASPILMDDAVETSLQFDAEEHQQLGSASADKSEYANDYSAETAGNFQANESGSDYAEPARTSSFASEYMAPNDQAVQEMADFLLGTSNSQVQNDPSARMDAPNLEHLPENISENHPEHLMNSGLFEPAESPYAQIDMGSENAVDLTTPSYEAPYTPDLNYESPGAVDDYSAASSGFASNVSGDIQREVQPGFLPPPTHSAFQPGFLPQAEQYGHAKAPEIEQHYEDPGEAAVADQKYSGMVFAASQEDALDDGVAAGFASDASAQPASGAEFNLPDYINSGLFDEVDESSEATQLAGASDQLADGQEQEHGFAHGADFGHEHAAEFGHEPSAGYAHEPGLEQGYEHGSEHDSDNNSGNDQANDSAEHAKPFDPDELRGLLNKKTRFAKTEEIQLSDLDGPKTPLNKFVGGKHVTQEPAAAAGPHHRTVPPEIRKCCMLLGLKPEELTRPHVFDAWKREMSKPGVHPDTGGDTEMAMYLNNAKDTLLRYLEAQAPKLGKVFGSSAKDGKDKT